VDVANSEPLKIECEHFLDCLQTRKKPLSDGWNGVAVVEILEKAQETLRG
jgi:predicted dehydrogenase